MGSGEEVANTRFASVGRDPVTLRYVANWSDEEDRHEGGGEFETVEDAVEWARARAPLVLVTLGFANPVSFSAGERYEPGEDPETDPLPTWPPSREFLNDLLADRYVQTVDLGEVFILGVDEDDEMK
jgi:hypothetical protein